MGRLAFHEIATKYAEDVVSGKILAGEYIIEACQRHLDDLARAGTDDFPYAYNPLMRDSEGVEYLPVKRVCSFIEKLPHVKGKWARERKLITLEPWQVFIVASMFGWININTALRRFKTGYVEVPRKNAKTTLASGIGLYLLVRDDEAGAEIYSAATTSDQAKISWQIAKQMVDKEAGMQSRFGVKTYAHSIAREQAGSFFQYLSSDSKGLDGLNIHGGIIDEVHAHKSRDVYDVIETGTGSREQPIIFNITTAGSNKAGICYELRGYMIKILDKRAVDETFFGMIYTIDKDDDWTDPAIWAKANPNLGVSCFMDDLERKCAKAKTVPSAQNNFKTKHLDVWVNADVAWMNSQAWDACADESLTVDMFHGMECWVGIDLASKVDIASMMQLFRREIDDVVHYYAFGKNYLPEETIYTSANDQYQGWVNDGRLTATPGNIIDFEFIERDMIQIAKDYDVIEFPYDPFQATQLSTRMMAEGLPMVEMRPTVLNFSEPMKELEALVLDGRFHHDGCPLLAWAVSNVICHLDEKDNIYPRKQQPENKIDPVVALIMALGRAITGEIQIDSVYEKRGIVRL